MSRRSSSRLNAGRSGASQPFTPRSIGELVLWLRSDLGITLSGSDVTAWADQSGAGNNVTSATLTTYSASDANANNRPSLTFGNTNSECRITNSVTMRHIFLVAYFPGTSFADDYSTALAASSTSPGDLVFTGNFSTANWRTADTLAGTRYRNGSATNTALTTANQAHQYDIVLNSDKTSSSWTIGRDPANALRHWRGGIMEVVGFSAELTGSDLANMRAYLKGRYATP